MELNTIQLPAFVLADLYRENLIIPEDFSEQITLEKEKATVIPDPEEMPVPVPSLGNNKHRILIVINQPDYKFLADQDLNFLQGILAACKLGMDDIALVNWHRSEVSDYKELIKTFKSQHVFLFGIDPVVFGLPISFPEFQIQSFNGVVFLLAPPLATIGADRLIKSKLWLTLKKIFNI